jgi:hypothetical protein
VGTEWPKSTATEKAGQQRGVPGLLGPGEVNSRVPRMAVFLGFSGRIAEQRDVTAKAYWRRDRNCRQTLSVWNFNDLE